MARELQCHGHSFKGIAEAVLSHNHMFYNDVFANLMVLRLVQRMQSYSRSWLMSMSIAVEKQISKWKKADSKPSGA